MEMARPAGPVMKDKIVEARSRSNRKKDGKNSNVDLALKVESTNHINGNNEESLHKTELSIPPPDFKKSKKDFDDIQAIIKLDRLNSTESKHSERVKSQNSFDFHFKK